MFRRWVLSGLILWWSAYFGCSQTSLVCSKRKKGDTCVIQLGCLRKI
jgi:hypothetical protein